MAVVNVRIRDLHTSGTLEGLVTERVTYFDRSLLPSLRAQVGKERKQPMGLGTYRVLSVEEVPCVR